MKRQIIYLIVLILLLPLKSFSQGFKITQLNLDFGTNQLLITYDIIDNNKSDLFYVWVEMEKKNGEPIPMKSLSGDLGENINGGKNKKISWVPDKDSVYLNEEVFVKVKAEKYNKSFDRFQMTLLSAAIPGLGQSVIYKGKPWWLTGVAAYGAFASGLVIHRNSLRTYNSYRTQQDPLIRDELFIQAKNQMNLSNALIVTGTALWVANILWVTFIPNNYKPLQHLKFSLNQSTCPPKVIPLLTFRLSF